VLEKGFDSMFYLWRIIIFIEIILVLQIGGGFIILFEKHDPELNASFILKIGILLGLIFIDKKIKKRIKWNQSNLTDRK